MKYSTFHIEWFTFDRDTGVATFCYHFDHEVFFEEKIYFYDVNFSLRKDLDQWVIENILFHIHIALGVSYYKLYCPKNIFIQTSFLWEKERAFWTKFYTLWLWEFLYRNHISPKNLFTIEMISEKKYEKKDFSVWENFLVPIGGGKDSIVSIELLKEFWYSITGATFAAKDNILYENTALIAEIPRLFLKREISPNILSEVEKWAYNGHVPISGIIAFVLELACYLYDFWYIVLSNEYSANFGNTSYDGIEVNHQWSKSYEFEKDFWAYVQDNIASHIHYFSLLRPFYEIKIASYFAKLGKKYFGSFSSCNTNFKIFQKNIWENVKDISPQYWCNACPKCLFVYIILRPFLTDEETFKIFWEELYEKRSLETLFLELTWLSGIKPFECVWESREVLYAIFLYLQKYPLKKPFLLELFEKKIQLHMTLWEISWMKRELFECYEWNNNIPKNLFKLLKNYESKEDPDA